MGLEDGAGPDAGHCRVCQVVPGPGDVAVLVGPSTGCWKCSGVHAGELRDNLVDPGTGRRCVTNRGRFGAGNWCDVRRLVDGDRRGR